MQKTMGGPCLRQTLCDLGYWPHRASESTLDVERMFGCVLTAWSTRSSLNSFRSSIMRYCRGNFVNPG